MFLASSISHLKPFCGINDMGLGLQFAAASGLAYRKAKKAGLGHELPTDWFTEDVHP